MKCIFLFLGLEDDVSKMTTVSNPVRPLSRLLHYAKKHKGHVRWAILSTIVNKIFDLAPPLLIGVAVDIVVKKEHSFLAALGFSDVTVQLWILAAATVVVWGLESIFEYIYARMWRNLAQTIQHELRLDVYDHVQHLQMGYFEDQSTGDLMSVLNDDVNQLERFLDSGASDLLLIGTSTVVVGIVFFWAAPSVAFWAILPLPFVLWASFLFQRKIGPHYADVRHKAGALNGQLANNLSGIETIKSFTTEQHELKRMHTLSDAYRVSNTRAIRLSSAFAPLIRMVIVVGFVGTLVLGGTLTIQGHIAVGIYSVLVFMTQRLLWPLTRLGSTFDLYQRAMASTRRIFQLLDTPILIHDGEQSLESARVQGAIAFEDVTFAYGDRSPILNHLNLDITSGSTVAFVGATGAGKSTLIRALQRFYPIQGGRILLDGVPIETYTLRDLRSVMGLVSQHVFLFQGTVRENIAYGCEDATLEEVMRAAQLAEAHGFIDALPDGYDTIIGERGQKLSGGQRQRLSIARAILKDPPILILDEATSAVDNETEAAIQRSLLHIAKGRTVLIIAHRLSTIRHADTIFVLEKGEICEQGTHEELIQNKQLYSRLWNVQTGTHADL